MGHWVEDDESLTGLTCDFIPKCLYCNAPMNPDTVKLSNFQINDGTGEKNAHATDVEVCCPDCGCWITFGVAISKERFEKTTKNLEQEGRILDDRNYVEKG